MIAALLLAGADLPPNFPKATPVTIEDVRRDPYRWAGRWVRIEGFINRCLPRECGISEQLAARRSNNGLTLSIAAVQSFDDWVQPMLPLRVSLVAKVDTACLADSVCLGRAPDLREPYVVPLETNLKPADEK